MPEKSADGNCSGHQTDHGSKLTKKRPTIHRQPTVGGSNTRVARMVRQS